MKNIRKNLIVIIGTVLFIILLLGLINKVGNTMNDPYKTVDKKIMKPFYESITENTEDIELDSIYYEDDTLYIWMYISGGGNGGFSNANLASLNQMIEQTVYVLNHQTESNVICSKVEFHLNQSYGRSPIGVQGVIKKDNGSFYFDSIIDNHSLAINQLYLFRKVEYISYRYITQEIDKDFLSYNPRLKEMVIFLSKEDEKNEISRILSNNVKCKIKIVME